MNYSTPPPAGSAPTRTVEEWAALKQTDPVTFRAVQVGQRWPQGAELAESEYDNAISGFSQIVLR